MKELVVAKKYARALFVEAQAKNELRAVQQGLDEFIRITRLRGSLQNVLAHPFIVPEEKKRIIRAALGEYATPLLERFLSLLVVKKRLDLVFLIGLEFQTEVDRFFKVQSVTVRIALAMPDAQKKELLDKLEKFFNAQVRMDVQLDPQLIGGLVVQTRELEMDLSVKAQLKQLQKQLTA